MATKTIPKTSDRKTLEIPLEELQEAREIWYGVGAFNQMLNKLDGDEGDLFAMRHFHKPLHDRFTDLMAGAPAWDQRMGEVEMGSEKLTPLKTDNAEFTLAVNVEDLQKIIDAASQIEANQNIRHLPSPVVSVHVGYLVHRFETILDVFTYSLMQAFREFFYFTLKQLVLCIFLLGLFVQNQVRKTAVITKTSLQSLIDDVCHRGVL